MRKLTVVVGALMLVGCHAVIDWSESKPAGPADGGVAGSGGTAGATGMGGASGGSGGVGGSAGTAGTSGSAGTGGTGGVAGSGGSAGAAGTGGASGSGGVGGTAGTSGASGAGGSGGAGGAGGSGGAGGAGGSGGAGGAGGSGGASNPLEGVNMVAVGDSHVCAVVETPSAELNAYCWGAGTMGQLNGDSSGGVSGTPVLISRVGPNVQQIVAAGNYTCVYDETAKKVTCWGTIGDNDCNQYSSTWKTITPQCSSHCDALTLAAGPNHLARFDSSQQVHNIGCNQYGQFGDSGASQHKFFYSEQSANVSHDFFSAALGRAHGCASTGQGKLFCWGDNSSSQVGYAGDAGTQVDTPLQINANGNKIGALSAGAWHTCALSLDGSNYKGVMCWGYNKYRQSAPTLNSPLITVPSDVTLPTSSKPTHVALGANHSCVVTDDFKAYCWGRNDKGQLGTGDAMEHSTVVMVQGDHSFSDIAAGGDTTCAIDQSKHLWCWGNNDSMQLGNGETGQYFVTPQEVSNHP